MPRLAALLLACLTLACSSNPTAPVQMSAPQGPAVNPVPLDTLSPLHRGY